MNLKMSNVLRAMFERLSTDASVVALVGNRVFNHVPQTTPVFPYIRFFAVTNADWSSKGDQGLDQEFQIDIWSQQRGDLLVAEIADAVIAATHNLTLTLPAGELSVMLQHLQTLFLVESDGITHHGVVRLRQLATS